MECLPVMQSWFRVPMNGGNLALARLALGLCACGGDASAWQIIGSVRDDAGNPIAGIGISATGRGETNDAYVAVMSEQDGSFHVEAFDGEWYLFADWSALNAQGFFGAGE